MIQCTVDWTAYLSLQAFADNEPHSAGQFPISCRSPLAAIGIAGLDALNEAELHNVPDHDHAFLIVKVSAAGQTEKRPFITFGVPYGPKAADPIMKIG